MTDSPVMPAKIGSTERTANVDVKNVSNEFFMIRIGYRYTSEPERFTEWQMIGPNEKIPAFKNVSFWTGWTTSGQVQWKVHGIRMETAHSGNGLTVNYNGKSYVLSSLYLAAEGIWKVHELREKDEGTTVNIEVASDEVRIISDGDGVKKLEFNRAN